VAGLYRGQWETVPVSYRSVAGAFDRKMLRISRNLLSAGLLMQYDQSGDAGLRWAQLGLLVSAAHTVGKDQVLSAGFGAAFVQRSFDVSKLTFKNQWDGDLFDPSLPSGENFDRTSRPATSLSAGLNWHRENASEPRNTLNAGLAIHHLNRPAVNFEKNSGFTLPVRLSSAFNITRRMNNATDLVAFTQYQQMGSNREFMAAAGARYWLEETAVRFTLGWREGDAIFPAIQLERGGWTLGLSYDWNISGFEVATRHRGGFELGLVYIDQPVPPVKTLKVCPIF
jgi:type IX secretion system PorP/SprF family membrane protein